MYQHNSHKSAWCRVLAVILAVSMVLIPVSFPGSAKAAEPDPGANVGYHFQDDFADKDPSWFENTKGTLELDMDPIRYAWTTSSNNIIVENSMLKVNAGTSYALVSHIKEEDKESGTKTLETWGDHTIEFTYNFGSGWTQGNYNQGVLAKVTPGVDSGRWDGYYFRLALTKNTADGLLTLECMKGKNDRMHYSGDNAIGTTSGTDSAEHLFKITSSIPITPGAVDIKIAFSGNEISATLSADGYPIASGSATDATPLADGTGGVFRGSNLNDDEGGHTYISNYKVTDTTDPNNPVVVFEDNFADSTSISGKDFTPSKFSSIKKEDISYSWKAYSSSGEYTSSSILLKEDNDANAENGASGYLYFPGSKLATMINATVNNDDVTKYWTDYTIETVLDRSSAASKNCLQGILGRITKDDNGHFSYYAIQIMHNDNNKIVVRIVKMTNQSAITESSSYLVSRATDHDTSTALLPVKVTFTGNKIEVFLNNETTPSVSTEDNDAPLLCGSAGIQKATASVTPDYYIDYFKVKLAGESDYAFVDEFADASYYNKDAMGYLHAVRSAPDSFTDPSWTVVNGKLYAVSPSGGQQYVVTDGSADWSNYTVSANVTLNSADEGDYVGLIAHASENGRYELRMTTAGLTLYSISDTAESLLYTYTPDAAYAVGTTYALKLEITKNGYIKVSVDNTEIDLNAEETKTYLVVEDGNKLAKGTAGVAVKGGAAYTDFAVSYPLIRSKEVSISLEGDIGVNFYFDLTEDVTANASAYSFRVTVPTSVGPVASDPIPVSDELLASPPGSTEAYYKVTGTVSAKSMAENVKVELLYNGETVVKAYEASVRQYADILLASAGDAEKLLIDTMLNYGAAAQNDFGHNTDNLANTGRDHTVGDLTYTELDAYKATRDISTGTLSGIAYKETTAVLQSKVSIYHYFTLEDGANPESYTVTVAGNEAQLRHKSDNLYYIAIEDIAAKDLDEAYTVTISDGSVTHTYTSSVYSYIRAVLKSEATSTTMQDLATTMYWYGQAANAYFAPAA